MNKRVLITGFLTVLFVSAAIPTLAQQRRSRAVRRITQRPAPQKPAPLPVLPDLKSDPDIRDADVAIVANITAAELRFEMVPNSTVEFLGRDKAQTIWHTDRFNLPETVQPGVTYRNIGIRLKIISRFGEIEKIVGEALGEIPIPEAPSPVSNPSATVVTQKAPTAPPRKRGQR